MGNAASIRSPRYDVEALREAAGERTFARGAAYHAGQQVEILAIEDRRVVARVAGSELYRAELQGDGPDFSGTCSCPAFADRGFCKHLVATALAVNAAQPSEIDESAGRLSRLRAHLRAQGIDRLVETIVGLAERDPDLLRGLELAAAADGEDDRQLFARFRKAITDATRTRGFIEYREAFGWAQAIDGVLDRLEGLIDRGRADIVLRLLGHFFDRMEQALGEVDDSDGHGGALCSRARGIHLAACRGSRPEPVTLARELFRREMGSDWGFFDGASEAYADVLGDAGLAEYHRLASAAWSEMTPRPAGSRHEADADFGQRRGLRAILDHFAAGAGDLDARIELRRNDLSSAYAYLELAQLCAAHGRESDALGWAEAGLRQFPDSPDERLIFCAADLHLRAGRAADAEALLWEAFERRPSLEIHARLKALATPGVVAEALTDRAVALVEARVIETARQPPPRWSAPHGDADLLVRLLASEGRLPAAWQAVHAHGCDDGVREALARDSEERHPAEALGAYAHIVERLLRNTGRSIYEEACRIIARMGVLRGRLGEAAAHLAYVEDLMARHKAKRTFVKMLRDTAPQVPRRVDSSEH